MGYRYTEEGRAKRMIYNARERAKREDKPYSQLNDEMTVDAFMEYALANEVYKQMYKKWKDNGFEYGATPTLDRVSSSKPYQFDNIQFLTFSDNARKNHDRPNFVNIGLNANQG